MTRPPVAAGNVLTSRCRGCKLERRAAMDPSNLWDVMGAMAALAADGWGHDADGRRLCPDCREAAGVEYNPGLEPVGLEGDRTGP